MKHVISALERHFLKTNGLTLHVVTAGPADGTLLLLLHGYPEFWYGWRNQIEFFARAGYRVVVPDQRGYNLSDKPRGVAAYNLDLLVADGVGLIDAMGRDQAIVVGHDWGGVVAWRMALTFPPRVQRLATNRARSRAFTPGHSAATIE